MSSVAFFAAKSALYAGIGAGVLLAISRPAIGAKPSLVQDFSCTIGGAFIGEIIGAGGAYLLSRMTANKERGGNSAIGYVVLFAGGVGLAVGTTAGAVASVALDYFKG